jgi:membrane-associated phospholipid phosphatase
MAPKPSPLSQPTKGEKLEKITSHSTINIASWLLPAREISRPLWPIALGIIYILSIRTLGGLTLDHFALASLCFFYNFNEKSRLFLKLFFPFILTGVIYDSMRYFYWQGISGNIHVKEPYFRELYWFGISMPLRDGHTLLTPNEFFAAHPYKILDLLCGFAYLFFVSEYLLTAFFLFVKQQFTLLRHFAWCFFIVNLMGFITYFLYPAAPPWYISQYGLGPPNMNARPTAAAAQRFDQILGTHFFDQIYSRGIDVFGAYPSLHVSYPFLVVLVTFQTPFRMISILFYLLMCLSAVYLQHHYVIDVLLGTLYAILAWIVVSTITLRPLNLRLDTNDKTSLSTRYRS